jgi:hypothetical protein
MPDAGASPFALGGTGVGPKVGPKMGGYGTTPTAEPLSSTLRRVKHGKRCPGGQDHPQLCVTG